MAIPLASILDPIHMLVLLAYIYVVKGDVPVAGPFLIVPFVANCNMHVIGSLNIGNYITFPGI